MRKVSLSQMNWNVYCPRAHSVSTEAQIQARFHCWGFGGQNTKFTKFTSHPGSPQESGGRWVKNMEEIQIPALFHKIQDTR